MADSTQEVLRHNAAIQKLLTDISLRLYFRGLAHDRDKLVPPQKAGWDANTPRPPLHYGTRAYYEHLVEIAQTTTRHYEVASHHPEHHPHGVGGMSILDLIEMLADWMDANRAHGDGNLLESIRLGVLRFKIEPQLAKILENTAAELEWL